MNKQGQGALEYLLLIGGAVLVASIVIALITGTTAGQKDPRAMAKCAPLPDCAKCVAKFSDDTMKCIAVGSSGTEKTTALECTAGWTSPEVFQYCGTAKTI